MSGSSSSSIMSFVDFYLPYVAFVVAAAHILLYLLQKFILPPPPLQQTKQHQDQQPQQTGLVQRPSILHQREESNARSKRKSVRVSISPASLQNALELLEQDESRPVHLECDIQVEEQDDDDDDDAKGAEEVTRRESTTATTAHENDPAAAGTSCTPTTPRVGLKPGSQYTSDFHVPMMGKKTFQLIITGPHSACLTMKGRDRPLDGCVSYYLDPVTGQLNINISPMSKQKLGNMGISIGNATYDATADSPCLEVKLPFTSAPYALNMRRGSQDIASLQRMLSEQGGGRLSTTSGSARAAAVRQEVDQPAR